MHVYTREKQLCKNLGVKEGGYAWRGHIFGYLQYMFSELWLLVSDLQVSQSWNTSTLKQKTRSSNPLIYHSLTKEYLWVEHLTSLPKMGVGAPSCYSDSLSLKNNIQHSRHSRKCKFWWHATLKKATATHRCEHGLATCSEQGCIDSVLLPSLFICAYAALIPNWPGTIVFCFVYIIVFTL